MGVLYWERSGRREVAFKAAKVELRPIPASASTAGVEERWDGVCDAHSTSE